MSAWVGRQYHRIRKRRCPHSIADPGDYPLSFSEIDEPYIAGADLSGNSMIHENLPVVKVNHRNDRFVGLFGRVVESDSLSCYQYLWVWDGQLFPIHAMDYAPAMVFSNLGEDVDRLVIYDKFHYKPRWVRLKADQCVKFRLNPFWNSFFTPSKMNDRHVIDEPSLRPLTDGRLRRWWGRDNVLDMWYGRPGDRTPHLKISGNLTNPMKQLLPWFNRFDKDSPGKIPTLERAAMWVRYIFVISSWNSRTLEDCIKTMQELITPAASMDKRFYRTAIVGLASYLVLLHAHGEIELSTANISWNRLFMLLDELKPKDRRSILITADKAEFGSDVLKAEFSESDGRYFQEVRSAVEQDRQVGVLEEELAVWYRSLRRDLSPKYRNLLYETMTEFEILDKESLER